MNGMLKGEVTSLRRARGEGKAEKRLLLQFVSLGGARGRAGAGGALDGAHLQTFALHELADARHDEKVRAHILRLFLDPDDFSGVGVLVDGSGNFRAEQRIELIE